MPLLVDEILLDKPGMTVNLINQLTPGTWQTPVLYIGAVLLLSLLLRLLAIGLNILQNRYFTLIAKEIILHLRTRLLSHLQTLAMTEYETLGTGRVVTNLVTDLDTLDQFIGTTISRLLVALLTIIGTAVILLWMHWQLGLFILLLNPLVIYFTRVVGGKVKHLKKKENSAYEIFQQALTETLEAIHQIRASNRERHYIGRLIDSARDVKTHASAFAWQSDAASRLSFLIFLFGFDIFRALAMLMVFYSDLSIGQMLAVFGYLWFMMAPVQEILGIQYAYYSAKAALERINSLTELRQEPAYPHRDNPFRRGQAITICIEQLNFAYGTEPVLNNINLTIKAGEKVALVGASGGGKSTLAQILIGLYTPQSGQIFYNNIPIEQIGLEVVREHVVTVLQHPILFNDTVRANLTLGRNLDDASLWKALKVAQIDDLVQQMPDGLETQIGRFGMRLSGGQRQRLAIARMIAADPKVVILDEATSALDTDTERRLHQSLATFLNGRTTLIIAHRLSAVRQADHVYVFEDGGIVEQGRHETLIEQNGLYASLYQDYL
ncbi:MAG: ABC transporter ATP-binding protein [Methylococcales bacterium]|nr:ABC transporter ATP-binding protein [Methylococcales bacterium]